MPMSPSNGASASGRTTRTFRISRSYFLPASAKPLLQVGEQSAVAHHLHEVRRNRLALQRFTGSEVRDFALFEINSKRVPVADAHRLGTDHSREAEVECVAVEEAGERFGDQRCHAKVLERGGRLLARGAGAEVAAADHDIARLHAARELGEHGLEAVHCDLVDAELHVAPRRDHVGVDVVAQHPGPHCSNSRGSQIRPATAVAATVYGEARYTWDEAAPMRPWKLRAVLEIATMFSGSRCSPEPAQRPQPIGSSSAPACRRTCRVPSLFATSWSRRLAGATRSRMAAFLPFKTRAAIRRSPSFAPVQAPM